MDDTLAVILEDTYSLPQLKHRLRVLKSDLVRNFFGDEGNEAVSETERNWLKSLPPQFFGQFNRDNIYQIFEGLQKKIEGLSVLTIYLTFEPNQETSNHLGIFIRKLFGPNLVFETRADPALIAGAAFSWKGVYKDYSLRTKIEERKERILEEFKKFLR